MIIPLRKINSTTQDNRKFCMLNISALICDISKKSQQNLLVQAEFLPKIDFSFFCKPANLSMRRESCVGANDNLAKVTWPN